MSSRERKEELQRIGEESVAHMNAVRASCQDSREHVRQSRVAIQRSLELLGWPFRKIDN